MKRRPFFQILFTTAIYVLILGSLVGADDIESRIIKTSDKLFGPATSKEHMVDSLIEFLDITLSLKASSKYTDEIKHHLDVAKDLFKNSSIFNDKARQYVALAYRMVTEGVKFQKPAELDEFITPTEAQEKASKYAKKLVEDACTSVRKGKDGNAAKLILELVLLIITPVSG
ncbi:MAG: hypothetical protein PVI66_12160 [Candidatus Aminicenantes bacterium]|jgi:hypothetical protein